LSGGEAVKGVILSRRKDLGGRDVASWRVYRPVVDGEKCVKCGLCAGYCPEAAITMGEEGPVLDLRFCKGCGVCANECPAKAIAMEKEG